MTRLFFLSLGIVVLRNIEINSHPWSILSIILCLCSARVDEDSITCAPMIEDNPMVNRDWMIFGVIQHSQAG